VWNNDMVNESDTNPDVTVVITAHREGVISGVTARSALGAINHLNKNLSKTAEILVLLDRTDDTTRSVLRNVLEGVARFVEVNEGDPGQVRNHGSRLARGDYISFLDGDDLWSANWLTEACRLVDRRPDVVAHSHCNVTFGQERNFWWHIDSEGPFFDPKYLEWANYWDAMAFARTEIYREFQFKPNDLEVGFGHEDWHWNKSTTSAGIAHKPALKTMHFKRRRKGSVSAKVNEISGTVWPT
jgi:glycosyltransferase involved in cell wall biosynthesis